MYQQPWRKVMTNWNTINIVFLKKQRAITKLEIKVSSFFKNIDQNWQM